MEQVGLIQLLHHPALERIFKNWDGGGDLSLKGVPVSAQAWLLAGLRVQQQGMPMVVLAPDVRSQEELTNDLEAWQCEALFLPELDRHEDGQSDPDLQAEVINVLKSLMVNSNRLLVTTEQAWNQEYATPDSIQNQFFKIQRGAES